MMDALTESKKLATLNPLLNKSVVRFGTRKSKGAGNGIFTDSLLFLCPKTARSLYRRVFIMVGVESEQFHLCTAFQTGFTAHRPTFGTVDGGLSTLSKEVTMKIHSHEPNSGYKSLSRFNVFLNGKQIAKNKSYPIAYEISKKTKGSRIKFSSFSPCENSPKPLVYQLQFDDVIGFYSDRDQAEKALAHLRSMGINVKFTILEI